MPELVAMFDAQAVKRRRVYEAATVAAWQTARLMRTDPKKRLPSLTKLFAELAPTSHAKQSVKQMAAVLKTLSQQYGIPLRKQAVSHG